MVTESRKGAREDFCLIWVIPKVLSPGFREIRGKEIEKYVEECEMRFCKGRITL